MFDRNSGLITQFREHRYTFVAAANTLAMVLKVTNHLSSNQEVNVFAKPNLKLDEARPYSNDWDETLEK